MLYLIFNEGYTASSGSELDRADLAREAIRLARMVHAQLPEDGEVTGLLALMLLTHSRREARTTAAGDLVPLDEQDRATWDRALIDEGTGLVKASLAGPALGPYQLQAAIAATHADAATAEETNWPQVHALYLILERIAPNPMVTLNRAIALAETEGPPAGLALLATLGRRRADGRASPAAVRAGAPAGEGRRPGRGVRALPARREGHRQPRRAALPGVPGQPGETSRDEDVGAARLEFPALRRGVHRPRGLRQLLRGNPPRRSGRLVSAQLYADTAAVRRRG